MLPGAAPAGTQVHDAIGPRVGEGFAEQRHQVFVPRPHGRGELQVVRLDAAKYIRVPGQIGEFEQVDVLHVKPRFAGGINLPLLQL